jgi:ferrous iron transport protein A
VDNHPNARKHHRQGQDWKFKFYGETPDPTVQPDLTPSVSAFPLSQAQTGMTVWIVGFQEKKGMSRLLGMGLTPGTALKILSTQPSGSVVVAIADNRLGLGSAMAHQIMVTDQPITTPPEEQMEHQTITCLGARSLGDCVAAASPTEISPGSHRLLREFPNGSSGRVKGYEKAYRGYKSKLLSMGLTPGTEFTVIRVAPLGDPIEINVRGFNLSLRKQEADALIVERL